MKYANHATAKESNIGMIMAKIKVSNIVLEDALFGSGKSKVRINGGYYEGNGLFTFDIEGDEVPKTENVICQFTQQTNCKGDSFTTQTFEPDD